MTRKGLAPIFLVVVLFGSGMLAGAQEQSYPIAGQPSPVQPVPQPAWSVEQLDNLVAPIALYPDPLLGQILVASTYPLEVVEANQWFQRNRNLHGQALLDAAKQQAWDPSIQALVAVPDALAKLNLDIRWTTDLGNAFLAQQGDVMNAVQRMRARARDNGRLYSTPQQTVRTQDQGGQQVIVIQPAEPQVVYVPAYDPVYVWGPPVYGFYPPLYYPAFGFGFGPGFNLAFCFDSWGGWGLWGWGPSWFGHSVFVNSWFFSRYGFPHYGDRFRGVTTWVHDPGHRMHVPYPTTEIAAHFGGGSRFAGNSPRAETQPRGGAMPYERRVLGGPAPRTGEQGYRASLPQSQRYQSQPQQSYQAQQQYRQGPRVAPFGGQSQPRYEAAQQYRSAPQQHSTTPQIYRAPQAQGSQSQPSQRFQAPPQQYRSAPQMSTPRFSGGGGFSRSSGSGFSRSGGGSSSRGGGGSRHR
jgi:uncharacterized membrane protein YgcG